VTFTSAAFIRIDGPLTGTSVLDGQLNIQPEPEELFPLVAQAWHRESN
jgi:hypothetical protein